LLCVGDGLKKVGLVFSIQGESGFIGDKNRDSGTLTDRVTFNDNLATYDFSFGDSHGQILPSFRIPGLGMGG
jgi:hypothetical protein